jgi:hypothetical protein
MAGKHEIEVFVAINEDGDFGAGNSDETAKEQLDNDHGGYVCRIIKLKLLITPPAYEEPIATINVPDQAGVTAAVETEA